MEKLNRKYLILIGGAVALVVLIFWWLGRSGQGPQSPKSSGGVTKETTPKIESQIPYAPSQVNLEDLANFSLPQTVSTFEFQGPPQRELALDEIDLIGRNFSFVSSAEERVDARGSRSYVFRDSQGRVLTIYNIPPSLHYSELASANDSATLPSLDEAKTLADEWLGKVGLQLPAGWEIKEVRSTYLAGHESVSVEVTNQSEANLTRVSLGYFYEGTPVVSETGKADFFNFVFGRGGSVISAKLEFLVNNLNLKTQKMGEIRTKNLEEVKQDFALGKAKAVSLDLSGVSSDELIIYPPDQIRAQDIKPVLLMTEEKLNPYYLVSSSGTLSSGRTGNVNYLISLSK